MQGRSGSSLDGVLLGQCMHAYGPLKEKET